MKVATYIRFKDSGEEALKFYEKVFDGKVLMLNHYSEEMTEDLSLIGKVFHGELQIGKFYIYVCDEGDQFDESCKRFKIVVEADSLELAKRYLEGLAEGGQVNMPLTKMPWDMYLSNVTDQYGVVWDVVYC